MLSSPYPGAAAVPAAPVYVNDTPSRMGGGGGGAAAGAPVHVITSSPILAHSPRRVAASSTLYATPGL